MGEHEVLWKYAVAEERVVERCRVAVKRHFLVYNQQLQLLVQEKLANLLIVQNGKSQNHGKGLAQFIQPLQNLQFPREWGIADYGIIWNQMIM